jgi:hypothetical protein
MHWIITYYRLYVWAYTEKDLTIYLKMENNFKHLCKIWGSHSGGYEELYLLEYNAV